MFYPLAVTTELRYFISQVKDDIDVGVLSSTSGKTLIDTANEVLLQKIWLFDKISGKHHKWDIYIPQTGQ